MPLLTTIATGLDETREGPQSGCGTWSVSLVSTGSYYGEDQNYTFTDHLYIDATSYLPVALVSEGIYDNG